MKWQQGRAEIDDMLAEGYLERVRPSREHADRLLGQAHRHLSSAEVTHGQDPEGAYGVLYDAGRKALWAILANQGLRPTTKGGHLAVYRAVKAQFDPPMGRQLRPFDRMRRQRHDAEYPAPDTPELTSDDVLDDLPKMREIVAICERLVDEMSVF